ILCPILSQPHSQGVHMRNLSFAKKSLRFYFLALLAALPLAGCNMAADDEVIVSRQEMNQITADLARTKEQNEQLTKEQTRNENLIKQGHTDGQANASEVARLRNENIRLTRRQDELESQVAELKNQLQDTARANFGLLSTTDQSRLKVSLDDFKSGK